MKTRFLSGRPFFLRHIGDRPWGQRREHIAHSIQNMSPAHHLGPAIGGDGPQLLRNNRKSGNW